MRWAWDEGGPKRTAFGARPRGGTPPPPPPLTVVALFPGGQGVEGGHEAVPVQLPGAGGVADERKDARQPREHARDLGQGLEVGKGQAAGAGGQAVEPGGGVGGSWWGDARARPPHTPTAWPPHPPWGQAFWPWWRLARARPPRCRATRPPARGPRGRTHGMGCRAPPARLRSTRAASALVSTPKPEGRESAAPMARRMNGAGPDTRGGRQVCSGSAAGVPRSAARAPLSGAPLSRSLAPPHSSARQARVSNGAPRLSSLVSTTTQASGGRADSAALTASASACPPG